MDTTSQSILETLRTVEFRLGLKGYNVDEVDEYLEKAAVEAESVVEQIRTLNERLRSANERVAQLESELAASPAERAPDAPAPVADDSLQRTLVLAQKFVEQAKRESEAEAAEVVSRAEERAHSVVADAEERARQIVADSEEHVREEVARLESTRTRLAGEVETMTKHVEAQRTRIRETLTEALRWFDDRIPPASARPQGAEREATGGPESGRPPQSDRRQPGGRPGSGGESGGTGPSGSQPATAASGSGGGTSASTAAASTSGSTPGTGDAPSTGAPARRGASVTGELFGGNGTQE